MMNQKVKAVVVLLVAVWILQAYGLVDLSNRLVAIDNAVRQIIAFAGSNIVAFGVVFFMVWSVRESIVELGGEIFAKFSQAKPAKGRTS